MKKEDLIAYKKHVLEVYEKFPKSTDFYLRGLAKGEIQGPSVGYPSIDKPQLKYYNFDEYLQCSLKETITEGLIRQNENNLNGIALEYFGARITYKKFFENIGALVKSFSANNVSIGDYVTVCAPGMPESMALIYALGYLGAVGIYLPPYLDKQTMVNDINKNHSKIIFIMDVFYDRFKDVFDDVLNVSSIEKIIIIPTLNSSPLNKFNKKTKLSGKFIFYNDFIEQGKEIQLPEMVKYEENMPAAVVYSSGTTGVLKGILLSHDTFNNSAASYKSFGFNLSKGQRIYQAIPLWSSTGLIADGTSALYYGCTLYQNPKFDPIEYSKNLGLHKINWGIATTELFDGLNKLQKQILFKILHRLGILDYSGLENIYIGGTLSTQKNKKRLNDILSLVGAPSTAKRSYGNCENGSIVTAELNGINHPDNSVGIPIPGTIVMAIDEEGFELPYNERGELVVKTNCGMIDYYNRPDLNGIFFQDETGKTTYKHTGDIGYIMPSGDVIYLGRMNDISIINGIKIYNFDIKNAILEMDSVYDAEVFINPNGNLCAHIVPYEKANIDLKAIQKVIFNKFNDIRYVPVDFKIRTSFPMASSTKRDFKLLKSETDGYTHLSNSYLTKQYTKRI